MQTFFENYRGTAHPPHDQTPLQNDSMNDDFAFARLSCREHTICACFYLSDHPPMSSCWRHTEGSRPASADITYAIPSTRKGLTMRLNQCSIASVSSTVFLKHGLMCIGSTESPVGRCFRPARKGINTPVSHRIPGLLCCCANLLCSHLRALLLCLTPLHLLRKW